MLAFGDKPAPAMAQIALRKTAQEGENESKRAAEAVRDNSYMDDICDSVHSTEDARQLTSEIDSLLEKGGFKVKEWLSNKDLVPNIEQQQHVKPLQPSSNDKVLGVVDELRFITKVECDQPSTKRKILSQVAIVYDPIGFATAFLIRAKIGMQELWQMGVDWDDELSPNLQAKWTKFFEELKTLNEVSFPRGLFALDSLGLPILCICADASEYAFGTCAYLHWKMEHSRSVLSLRNHGVAPLKKLTIPRLELQAALLASSLSTIIQKESRLEFEEIISVFH